MVCAANLTDDSVLSDAVPTSNYESSKLNTTISVDAEEVRLASDVDAGEKGSGLKAVLKDNTGKALSNKHVQIIMDDYYDVLTNELGEGYFIQIN